MTRNLVRLIIGALLAIPVAGGLFFIMQYLIASADLAIDDKPPTKLADIFMPEREIEVQVDNKPDKVDDPEEPPPDLDTPDVDMDMDNMEVVNVAPQTNVEIAIDGTGMGTGDGEYLPIVKVAPIYPQRAQRRGQTGYCIVEYTVTASGAIRDPKPVDCQPSGVFEKASVKAALKFKYKPRKIDGVDVEVPGVQNKFTYEMEN